MRRALLVALLISGLLAVTPASARVVPLNWNETFRWRGQVLMTFKVERITFANTGWGVTAAFTNRSNETLRIVKKRFMLRLYKTRRVDNRTRYVYVLATGIDPPMPPTLAPGQTWRGGFGGKALPRRGEYVRVAFGRFARLAPGLPREWHWVTDHTFRY